MDELFRLFKNEFLRSELLFSFPDVPAKTLTFLMMFSVESVIAFCL